jgi:hypothetical protein
MPPATDTHGKGRVLNALDNPIWHALIGPHARFAIGRGAARRYPAEMAPFAAIAEPTAAAYTDLAADLPPGADVMLFRPTNEPVAPRWEAIDARMLEQMILSPDAAPPDSRPRPAAVPLGPADAADMLTLVDLTKPARSVREPSSSATISACAIRTGALSAWPASAFVCRATSN